MPLVNPTVLAGFPAEDRVKCSHVGTIRLSCAPSPMAKEDVIMGVSRTLRQSPWQMACELHTALAAGSTFPEAEVPPAVGSIPVDHGEYVVGVFGRPVGRDLDYARFTGEDVRVVSSGPAVVVGPAHVVGAYALGSLVGRRRVRKRAERVASPQWRQRPLAHVVVTTRRLWCQIPGDQWKHFTYDTRVNLRLDDNHALEMWFGQDIPAARLGGPWAPWIAVAVAHLTHGPTAGVHLSWLARFRIPSRTPL
jgi:hypothetical protein